MKQGSSLFGLDGRRPTLYHFVVYVTGGWCFFLQHTRGVSFSVEAGSHWIELGKGGLRCFYTLARWMSEVSDGAIPLVFLQVALGP